jgi:hypothetical protein
VNPKTAATTEIMNIISAHLRRVIARLQSDQYRAAGEIVCAVTFEHWTRYDVPDAGKQVNVGNLTGTPINRVIP